MNFTLCCLKEETEAVLDIEAKAVQVFATWRIRLFLAHSLFGHIVLVHLLEEWPSLIELVGTFSLRLPHSSVMGTFLKVM